MKRLLIINVAGVIRIQHLRFLDESSGSQNDAPETPENDPELQKATNMLAWVSVAREGIPLLDRFIGIFENRRIKREAAAALILGKKEEKKNATCIAKAPSNPNPEIDQPGTPGI